MSIIYTLKNRLHGGSKDNITLLVSYVLPFGAVSWMNCLECDTSLRWNPLKGMFECETCKTFFLFRSGQLQSLYANELEM